MLYGQSTHSIDNKNRIMIPTKFRDDLGKSFMITKGIDGNLSAYPMAEWEAFMAQLTPQKNAPPEVIRYKRFFMANAEPVEMDKQGRILIPSHLASFAQLTDSVVSVGMKDYLEIWSKERWDAYENGSEDMYELAQKVAEYGL
ncbi:Cell division protein MraZ [Clostridiaceae bacterium JG1575]|nr:Cell division protein MraZ [Clostridiaceae bacterium JG1575]